MGRRKRQAGNALAYFVIGAAKVKKKGIGAVSFSIRGKKRRGKKGLDRWAAKVGDMSENRIFSMSKGRQRGLVNAVSWFSDRFQKADWLDERRRILDELENNPEKLAQRIRENRVMELPGGSTLLNFVNTLTRSILKVQREETKLPTQKEKQEMSKK